MEHARHQASRGEHPRRRCSLQFVLGGFLAVEFDDRIERIGSVQNFLRQGQETAPAAGFFAFRFGVGFFEQVPLPGIKAAHELPELPLPVEGFPLRVGKPSNEVEPVGFAQLALGLAGIKLNSGEDRVPDYKIEGALSLPVRTLTGTAPEPVSDDARVTGGWDDRPDAVIRHQAFEFFRLVAGLQCPAIRATDCRIKRDGVVHSHILMCMRPEVGEKENINARLLLPQHSMIEFFGRTAI